MSAARQTASRRLHQQRVFEAADRLAASGSSLTLKALRKELGGGSYRELCPALRAWREARWADSVPHALARRVQKLAAEAWKLAASLSAERLKAERSGMLREQAEQQRECDENAERLKAELRQARAELLCQQQRATAAEQATAECQGQLEQLRQQGRLDTRALREAHAKARAARERAARLQGHLEALRGQH